MLRPGAEKGAAPPDPGGKNDRRNRADHLPVGLRRVSHILLHPLQGLLLEYDRQASATHNLHEQFAAIAQTDSLLFRQFTLTHTHTKEKHISTQKQPLALRAKLPEGHHFDKRI